VGKPPLPNSVVATSDSVAVDVRQRLIGGKSLQLGSTTLMMEWEPWFTPFNWHWTLNEAVPVVGKYVCVGAWRCSWLLYGEGSNHCAHEHGGNRYDSFNVDVMKQHCMWMRGAGVGAIVVDWTNNLWGRASWSQRQPYAQEIINATTFTISMYDSWRSNPAEAGFVPPAVVLLMGLDNGASEPMAALNEQVAWVSKHYLGNYSKDNWVILDGKPLLLVFDGGNIHTKGTPLVAPDFTVRWMSTQLQSNGLQKLGYWSWMDVRGGIGGASVPPPLPFPPLPSPPLLPPPPCSLQHVCIVGAFRHACVVLGLRGLPCPWLHLRRPAARLKP